MQISGRLKAAVGMLIVVLIYIGLIPTFVDQVQGLNTTGWTFTGYSGAITLVNLIPFVIIAGALLLIISDAL